MSTTRPGVLMVTGAYYPELSGGGLQCKATIDELGGEVDFAVLTTCTDPQLSLDDSVDGTPVRRVRVNVASVWSKSKAALSFARAFVDLTRTRDIVHLHGFSQKSTLAVALARLLGKRVVITLHTAGQDEPAGIRKQGALAYWAYSHADLFIAISSRLAGSVEAAGIDPGRMWRGSNGLDTKRFRPAAAGEVSVLRQTLGLPADATVILFVGFFSADKGPQVLFEAWRRLAGSGGTHLVYVGTTRSRYYEVDPALADAIRDTASREGLLGRITFVESTHAIDRYYRAADIFVFPSRREAFGMALVEAMASGLACVASRLRGVTDEIVREGVTGLLVEPHDVDQLSTALARLLGDRALAARLGQAARADIEDRFDIARTARGTLAAYRRVLNPLSSAVTPA